MLAKSELRMEAMYRGTYKSPAHTTKHKKNCCPQTKEQGRFRGTIFNDRTFNIWRISHWILIVCTESMDTTMSHPSCYVLCWARLIYDGNNPSLGFDWTHTATLYRMTFSWHKIAAYRILTARPRAGWEKNYQKQGPQECVGKLGTHHQKEVYSSLNERSS